MEVLVLGELVVVSDDGASVAVPGTKERLLLAVLAAACPAVVPVDRLVDLLWDGDPPATGRKTLQAHVVRLRSALEPGRPHGSPGRYVARRGAGYALTVDRADVDAHREADRTARGRAWLTADPALAVRELDTALRAWRGEPYADWPAHAFAVAERRRLGEVHAAAISGMLEGRLALGQHADIVPDLEQLVIEDPLREGWWRLLVLALYRDGRQADALAAFRRARTVLDDELGVPPGPELRRLERAVLAQDPALELSSREVPQPRPQPAACPWLGLATYQPNDSARFHGRRQLVAQLVRRLADRRVLVVSGPSGAGKSSLLRAGAIPAVAAGALPGSATWRPLVVTPGRDAVDALAGLAGEAPPSEPVLLVCDQSEELWAPGTEPAEATAFLDALLELVGSGVVARCVLVVRGDHLGRLSEHAAFAEHAQRGLLLVPSMTDPELREVVQEPAVSAGLRVEPELVEAIVSDVVGRAGALPLLSTALVGTWERRRGDLMTLAGYLQAGGVAGALMHTAEDVVAGLDDDGREVARRILVRLADGEPGGLVRRVVPLQELELDGESGHARREVVEAFVRRRLLAVDRERLEVAHEVLLTAWPRLARWLEEDASGRAVRRHLAPAAVDWEQAGEPEADLYRGARLGAALDWLDGPGADPTGAERRFVVAAKELQSRELAAARARVEYEVRARGRTRRLALGLAAALVGAVTTAGLALSFQRDAEARAEEASEARTVADSSRLAALSTTADAVDVSLLLAVQALRIAGTPEAEDSLIAALAGHPRAVRAVPFDGRAQWAGLTADGGTLFVAVGDAVVSWSVAPTTQPHRVVQADDWGRGWVTSAVSRSGGLFVAGGWGDENDPPWLRVHDSAGALQLLVEGAALGGMPLDIAFREDGGLRIVVVDGPAGLEDGMSWEVVELDPGADAVRRTGLTGRFPPGPAAAVAGPSGDSFVVWSEGEEGTVTLVDVLAGTTTPLDIGRIDAWPSRVAVLPGVGFGVIHLDGRLTVHDGAGTTLASVGDPSHPVHDVVSSPDGAWVATVGGDGDVRVYDRADGPWVQRETLTGHTGTVVGAEVRSDGKLLFTVGRDGQVLVWDMAGGGGFGEVLPGLRDRWVSNRPQVVFPGELVVAPTRPESQLVPGGQGPAADSLDVSATFLDPRTSRVVDEVEVGTTVDEVIFGSSVSVSPDRRRVAVTSGLRTTVLDTTTREVLEEIDLPPTGDVGPDGAELKAGQVWCTGWSPDGSQLWIGASRGPFGGDDGALVVVDATSGDWEQVRVVELGIAPQSVEVSPNRRTAVVLSAASSELLVLDAGSLAILRRVQVAEEDLLADLSFSPDGRWLAAAGEQGRVHLYDTSTWEPLGSPVAAHADPVPQVEWTDDSRTVVTASMDGTVALLDRERRVVRANRLRASTALLEGYGFVVPSISEELLTLAGQRPGRRYSLVPADWVAAACTVVGRDLTEDEWARYLTGRPWEPTCSDLA